MDNQRLSYLLLKGEAIDISYITHQKVLQNITWENYQRYDQIYTCLRRFDNGKVDIYIIVLASNTWMIIFSQNEMRDSKIQRNTLLCFHQNYFASELLFLTSIMLIYTKKTLHKPFIKFLNFQLSKISF